MTSCLWCIGKEDFSRWRYIGSRIFTHRRITRIRKRYFEIDLWKGQSSYQGGQGQHVSPLCVSLSRNERSSEIEKEKFRIKNWFPRFRFCGFSIQTISGTGANHYGGAFLERFYEPWQGKKAEDKIIYISNPTWGTSSFLSPSFTSSRPTEFISLHT